MTAAGENDALIGRESYNLIYQRNISFRFQNDQNRI